MTILTLVLALAVAAFALTLAAAAGIARVPLWVPVLLLAMVEVIKAWPPR